MGRVTQRVRVVRIEQDGSHPRGSVGRRGTAGVAIGRTCARGHHAHLWARHRTGARLAACRGRDRGAGDVLRAQYCAGSIIDDETGTGVNTYNVLDLALAAGVVPPPVRGTFTSSACGVCGADSIETLSKQGSWDVALDRSEVSSELLLSLPSRLRAADLRRHRRRPCRRPVRPRRPRPRRPRGAHRHNAVDKVIGWAILSGRLPLSRTVLQVSGRLSFELVQKAYLAGIPIVSAVSAPSSLAVDTARHLGLTVAGFVRGASLNLYTHPHRVRT